MAKHSPREITQRTALCGLLIAMMLVLGYLERFIPMPVPGMKLGLSNSVLIFAVYMLDLPTAWLLMGLKVTLNGLMFGTIASSALIALGGGIMSMLAMMMLSRLKMHPVTVSMMGGAMHNVGQVMVVMLMSPNPAYLRLLAILMLTGLGFGALTGTGAMLVMRHLRHLGLFKKLNQQKKGFDCPGRTKE